MSEETPTAPAFIKIQDTVLELTGCVSFKIADGDGDYQPNTLLVETRLTTHAFGFDSEAQAKSAMRQIESTIHSAGHEMPHVRR